MISSIESLIWKCVLLMTKQPYWLMTDWWMTATFSLNPCRWILWLWVQVELLFIWSRGCVWMLMKAIFSQLSSLCSQLATGSGNFLCSCAFLKKKQPSIFLFIYCVFPTNTKANDIWLVHILQDRICCLWHISSPFLSDFHSLVHPRWPHLYIILFPPSPHKML